MALIASSVVFALSVAVVLSVFGLNMVVAWLACLIRGEKVIRARPIEPRITVVVAARNAGSIIEDKIQNTLSLDYPADRIELIVSSDGSTDRTEDVVKAYLGDRVRLVSSSAHEGKNSALNRAVPLSSGEILVFTDADARIDKGALRSIVPCFSDEDVGGVCGQRVIAEDETRLERAQSYYIGFDSRIKRLESKAGSITSNDGKLYAVRKGLFEPLPPGVTDDFFVSMLVTRQGKRFVFEPRAKAFIRTPSRSTAHEIERRRRIVSTCMRAVFVMRELLNPFRFGVYSFELFSYRVARSFLPVALISLFLASAHLALYSMAMALFFLLQSSFYATALAYPLFLRRMKGTLFERIGSTAYYFCVGNIGTLLGLVDFMLGRETTIWEPRKTDV